MTAVAASPFDELAARYDDLFTRSLLGTLAREAVWRRLDRHFDPGMHVLELGCGTGEDACHLASRGVRVTATDPSGAMLDVATRKAADAGVSARVTVLPLDAADLAERDLGSFDGAFSSLGALNCVADLAPVARGLARSLPPGAPLVLVLLGPCVPWEWLWYGARGDLGRAFRRFHRGGVVWKGLTVHYPRIGKVARAFAPAFRRRSVRALGALVPPSYAETWATRHPRLVRALAVCEERLAAAAPLPWLADHYILELSRTSS